MNFNPNKHHRRSIRLKGYDYSQAGLYFITICCQDRIWRFGKIENNEMILNEYGQIAFDEWMKLTERFSNFELDIFQIMPNHIHGVIRVGATLAVAPNDDVVAPTDTKMDAKTTVSDIVGAYKSLVANGCLKIHKSKNETMGKLWQRNYYEHIIRNEQSYLHITEYIINNPLKWQEDTFYKSQNSP